MDTIQHNIYPQIPVRGRRKVALFFLSIAAAAAAVPTPSQKDEHGHAIQSDAIIVTAPFVRDRTASLTPVSVLTRESLARELRSTIGETLARQPGVSATSFGPNASRPILRGFPGDRKSTRLN